MTGLGVFSVNVGVVFVTAGDTDYVMKVKLVGNNIESWCSLSGTPIIGAALITTISAEGAGNKFVGFGGWGALPIAGNQFDNLYVLHAVINEPTVALGATEDVLGRNIAADFQEPSEIIATITAIEGITGVLSE